MPSIAKLAHELPLELPNDLTFRILENQEILEKPPFQKLKNAKVGIKLFLSCPLDYISLLFQMFCPGLKIGHAYYHSHHNVSFLGQLLALKKFILADLFRKILALVSLCPVSCDSGRLANIFTFLHLHFYVNGLKINIQKATLRRTYRSKRKD